jgi:hypothetical protein
MDDWNHFDDALDDARDRVQRAQVGPDTGPVLIVVDRTLDLIAALSARIRALESRDDEPGPARLFEPPPPLADDTDPGVA